MENILKSRFICKKNWKLCQPNTFVRTTKLNKNGVAFIKSKLRPRQKDELFLTFSEICLVILYACCAILKTSFSSCILAPNNCAHAKEETNNSQVKEMFSRPWQILQAKLYTMHSKKNCQNYID